MMIGARPAPGGTATGAGSRTLALARAVIITALLGAAIALRWTATVGAMADGVLVGAAFGALLIAVAGVAGWRPGLRPRRLVAIALLVGLAGGLALVAISLAVHLSIPWIAFRPSPTFAPWAAVTVLVAVAEEVVLRGALFDAVEESGGVIVALLATSLAFALLHVPLYGWHVVPLDLGVGLFLGGLRMMTGDIAAPAMAHVVADLATWWM